MRTTAIAGLAMAAMAAPALAYDIPDNVQAFYDKVKNGGSCTGSDLLKGGFYAHDDGSKDYGYCQKYFTDKGFYIKGSGSNLADMDIDCDGNQDGIDPRCDSSDDTQAETAFKDQVKSDYGIPDLRSDIHPYVVLGNYGDYSPTFDPEDVGIKPLSLVAVVCNKKLLYGIWGDTNGDDGPPLVGESSLALATACFGDDMNGDNGHDESDVLYIAFKGDEAVPGDDADWSADSYEDFAASIKDLGDKLVSSL